MKKIFCFLAVGSFLGVIALLILNSIEEINVKFSRLFVIAFLIFFILSFVYLLCKDSYKTKEKLKALNRMSFCIDEKKSSDGIKIQIDKENFEFYKIYCNTLIEI